MHLCENIILRFNQYIFTADFRFIVQVSLLMLIIFSMLIFFINILYIFNHIDDLKENQYNVLNYLYLEKEKYTKNLLNKNNHICCICLKKHNTVVIVFQPCNHACMCKSCFEFYVKNNYDKCPICLNKFLETIIIYLS